MIVGNDIARYQGDVNYEVYKDNSHFVIIKATEGVGYIDPKYARNRDEARRVGLPLGYYHFARPDLGNSPENEAIYFCSVVTTNIREGETLYLDYEPASNPFAVVDWCKRFLDTVFTRTGVRPMIYLNKSQVRGFDWGPVAQSGYALWLACYDQSPTYGAFNKMAMQQWTSSQKVPGIVGNADGDWFFGDVDQFKSYGYHAPVVPSSSESPSPSPSLSKSASPSVSSSPSKSASASESASVSPSSSSSPSVSKSPSPSPASDCCEEIQWYRDRLSVIHALAFSKWTWIGVNGWKNRLKKLQELVINRS